MSEHVLKIAANQKKVGPTFLGIFSDFLEYSQKIFEFSQVSWNILKILKIRKIHGFWEIHVTHGFLGILVNVCTNGQFLSTGNPKK